MLQIIEVFSDVMQHYISTYPDGQLLIDSGRKTGFMGLVIGLQSTIAIFKEQVLKKYLMHIPVYNASQDHVEMFFHCVRSRLGCNNNPTTVQFRAAYKRLIVQNEIKASSNGNCLPLEEVEILKCSSANPLAKLNSSVREAGEEDLKIKFDANEVEYLDEREYLLGQDSSKLSEGAKEITVYVAGFVVRTILKRLKCAECSESLVQDRRFLMNTLLAKKNRGGLICPSQDVIKIVQMCEKQFKALVVGDCANLVRFPELVAQSILKSFICSDVFSDNNTHFLETPITANHRCLLIKAIIMKYLDVRLYYYLKQQNNPEKSVRKLFTKLILFKG